jgi:ankyrin repeat protein
MAAATDNGDAIDLLIAYGAKINGQNCNGSTPLHYAAYYGKYLAVKNLLENHADIAIKESHGYTAYDFALYAKHANIARLISTHADSQQDFRLRA